ncbi:hypothetical protein [Devosia sp.]|uniref:hypothetical protein n=1 Tax=Devosia sp. TaxID=1871048 RepID=UPI001AFE7E1F|nr:hypothetical protein [Devosia sp.]MBO9589541.1 hypothetical protein [Devosia sp.]
MRDLIATKSMTYATRRLLPGDEFQANNRDARTLVAIKKAKEKRIPGQVDAPPATVAQKVKKTNPMDHDKDGAAGGSRAPEGDKDALNRLRADYAEVLGKRPFSGWDVAELQRRIDEALAS